MATVPQPGGQDPSSTAPMSSRSVSPVPTRSVHEDEGPQAEGPDESPVEDDAQIEEETRMPREDRHVTPEVRYYNFEGFMNRMVGDQGDYVIEVLVTNAEWFDDIEAESVKREQRANTVGPPEAQKEKTKDASKMQLKLDQGSKTPLTGRIHRVRIRSKAILDALSVVSTCEELTDQEIFEFCAPFKLFEYSHPGMKDELAKLEIAQKENMDSSDNRLDDHSPKVADIPDDKTVGTEQALASDKERGPKEGSNAGEASRTVLQHMRCYVDFVGNVILPIWKKFERWDKKTRPTVKYEEIPYLFRPGALAFLPRTGMNRQTLQRSSVQQIWRMVHCRPNDALTKASEKMEDKTGDTKWTIYCLDFDGDKLFPVWEDITFHWFYGERDITSLECYPLEFQSGYETLLDEQSQFGQVFKSCIADSVRHLYYTGWTPIAGIRAESLTDDKGEEIRYPEYIESEVVIDFKEALRNHPQWETDVGDSYDFGTSWYAERDHDIHPLVWEEYPTASDGSRGSYMEHRPILTRDDISYSLASKKYTDSDRFIAGKAGVNDEIWSKEDLALLPKRLFGYVLRERRFARLDVKGIDTSTQRTGVSLDDIQMKPSRRRIIRSAVSAHFRSRQQEKEGLSTINLDVIRGKGKGLVILLHGPPGVGKTATAEAVAIENSKPLFPITCGDLGFTPSAVDKTLREIFRYAHLWDCILLLDEADIFLTQRKSHGGSLERHALVGVFLRVLEYYSGILFITTNRVGAIDEAFQSRVHLSLYYPHLSLNDTIEILASNLKRLPRVKQGAKNSSSSSNNNNSNDGYIKVMDEEIFRFVQTEYEDFARAVQKPRGPWNGRQIRNAVQIAAGLALYDKEAAREDDGLPAILTADHFRDVADTMSEFEDYLRSARAGDSNWLARQRQDRNDDFQQQHQKQQQGGGGGAGVEQEPFPGVGVGGSSRSPAFPNPEPRATPRGNLKSKTGTGSGPLLPGSAGSAASRRKGLPPLAAGGGSAGRPAAKKGPVRPARAPAAAVQQRMTRVIAHGEFEYDEEEDEFEQRHDDDFGGEEEEEELGLEQEMEGEGEGEDWDGSPSHHHRQAAVAPPYGHNRTSLVGRRTNQYVWNQER